MLQHKRFQAADELVLFCQGAIQGGTLQRLYPLAGLTLTFTTPSGAVTFTAGANPEGLTLQEIQAQIAAVGALAGLKVVGARGVLHIVEATPKDGVAFGAGAQAARRVLGFPESGVLVGQVMHGINSGRAPAIVSITATNHEHNLFWETDASHSTAPSAGGSSIANPAGALAPGTVLDPPSRAIYIGGAGNLTVHRVADAPGVLTTYVGLQPGNVVLVAADLVSNSTTATQLVIEQK